MPGTRNKDQTHFVSEHKCKTSWSETGSRSPPDTGACFSQTFTFGQGRWPTPGTPDSGRLRREDHLLSTHVWSTVQETRGPQGTHLAAVRRLPRRTIFSRPPTSPQTAPARPLALNVPHPPPCADTHISDTRAKPPNAESGYKRAEQLMKFRQPHRK